VGFQKIGPYEITRWDLLVAAIIISFRIGSIGVRLLMTLMLLLALGALAVGIAGHDAVEVGMGVFLLFVLFGVPALRSRKNSREIYLQQHSDGLAFDMPNASVVYKWSTIGKVRKIGPRLFIMVTARCALVIPDRATSPANMESLQASIAEHLAA